MAYFDMSTSPSGGSLEQGPKSQSVDARSPLAGHGAKLTQHQPHSVLYYESDPVKRLYEVVKGSIMLFKLLPDGRRQVVEVLTRGDVFGFSDGEEHDCTAETLTLSEVHEIDLRKVEQSDELQRILTKCLTNQMRILHEHAVLLGRKSAVERVTSFFMHLVPERGGVNCIGPQNDEDDSCDIQLHMTRQEIADYLGLTIETVSRVISDLKRKGVIRVEKADRIHLNKVCGVCQMTGMH